MILVSEIKGAPSVRLRFPLLSGSVVGLVFLLSSVTAGAQELDAETRTAARELARQGADAFESRDYVKALDRFDRAFTLFQAPSIAVMQARALVRLERLVEALDKYENTQRMALSGDAPEAFRQAVNDAKREGEELRMRIPRLAIRIHAAGERPQGLSVMLDGKHVPRALWDVERPVNPGTHTVVTDAPGYTPLNRTLSLAEGQRAALDLHLQPQGPGLITEISKARADSSAPKASGSDRSSSRPAWGFVALGVGAAGLSVSAITGLIALNKKSDLDSVCKPGCPAESREDIAAFRSNRTISYASLALGLSATGVGSYLLLSGSRDSAHLGASVGFRAVTLHGVF